MSGRGRGLRPKKVKLPSCSAAEDLATPSGTDSVACIRCHVKDLISKLQNSKQLDDACSLMGMVTSFGQQLKEYSVFFTQMMLDVYRILEDAEEHLLRVVLLHLVELVAANGELCPSTRAYYKSKVVLPKSCEDAFNAAMKFGQENSCSPSVICSCQKSLATSEIHSPEVMNEPGVAGAMASASFDGASDHSGATVGQKLVNNDIVDEDNLADVFGKCMASALSNCPGGNLAVSQPLEELVKAEKEEGPEDATQSQVLPSTTTFELPSGFSGSPGGGILMSDNKDVKEDDQVEEEEQKGLKEEEKTKKYERLMKVRGDVIVRLASDSKDHLQEVFNVLYLHFNSAPFALPENAATVPTHSNQKVKTYSREFLLECSSSGNSRKHPRNWSWLSRLYPEICLVDDRSFTADSYCTSPRWCVEKRTVGNFRRANSSPYPGGDHADGTGHSELLAVTADDCI